VLLLFVLEKKKKKNRIAEQQFRVNPSHRSKVLIIMTD